MRRKRVKWGRCSGQRQRRNGSLARGLFSRREWKMVRGKHQVPGGQDRRTLPCQVKEGGLGLTRDEESLQFLHRDTTRSGEGQD